MAIGAFKQDIFLNHGHAFIDLLDGKTFNMGFIRNDPGILPIGDGTNFALQSAIYANFGSYMNMAIWEAKSIQSIQLRLGLETAPASISSHLCIKY
jgi:hypothetical protein